MGFSAVLRREWRAAFATPLAYLFIAAYAVLTTVATFEFGELYARGQADLSACFALQPWLLVWLAPALSMRFWAEERRQGTIESLLTLPIGLGATILAKWVVGVALLTLALATTTPLWATVAYLGHPDHGAILAGYLGSLLLGATLLALGSALSAATRHQVSAFIATVGAGVLLLLAGHPAVADLLRDRCPASWVEAVTDLGALSHHRALTRGVIGLDDVAYFFGLSAAGLTATAIVLLSIRELPIVLLRRVIRPRLAALLLTLMILTLSLAAPRLLGQARLDLTQERLYTLAPATRHLIEGLEQPITLTLVASAQTLAASPAYASEARRVRELLSDITARARDRVHLAILDPPPFSEDEDRAAEAGLRSLAVGEAGDNLWLGLIAESEGTRTVIDLFEPSQSAYLEYRIARLLRQVARPHRPTVGLLSTLAAATGTLESTHLPWAIEDALREQYDIRDVLPQATLLPPQLDALLVLHPKGLSPELLRDIDRYLTHGGRALIAIDPDAQFDGQREEVGVGVDHASTFEPFLHAWGLRFDPTLAVGDLDNALLVGAGRGDRPVRHLGFAGFGAGSLATNDLLTSGLHRLDFATPGFLETTPIPGVSTVPLVQTSTSSAPLKVADLVYGATPETLRHGFRPTGRRYVIATHLRGRLPAAFPENASTPHQPANVVIVADTDWLADMLWIRDEDVGGTHYREPWANNGDFLLNVVDELTGGDELVALRGREPMPRPFARLDAIRNHADRRLAAQSEALERSLADVNRRIADLSGGTVGGPATNPQQRGDLASAEVERRRFARALRGVHHELDREAARLGRILYATDVCAAPLLLLIAALLVLSRRRRRAGT